MVVEGLSEDEQAVLGSLWGTCSGFQDTEWEEIRKRLCRCAGLLAGFDINL